MIAGWIESALAIIGMVSVLFLVVGFAVSIIEWIEDMRWSKRLSERAQNVQQAVGTPSLDDPEACVWSWYDGKRWHTERREKP
ncbi:MAG: hypothetical protein ACLGPL_06590 [Acidobacteriota bacterium]